MSPRGEDTRINVTGIASLLDMLTYTDAVRNPVEVLLGHLSQEEHAIAEAKCGGAAFEFPSGASVAGDPQRESRRADALSAAIVLSTCL